MDEFLFSHGEYVAYLAITLFMISTGAGFPLPEEVFIIAAGVASAQGVLNPWLAVVALLVGGLAGDCIIYWIGFHFGRNVVREHRWWARFVKPEREAKMEQMIHKHGLKVLFLARFLVGLRSPVYLTAGILHVRFRRFVLIDLFCATVVIGSFFSLSYLYGETIYGWIRKVEGLVTLVVVLGLLVVGIYFWRRHRRRVGQAEVQVESADAPSSESDNPEQPPSKVERVA